MVTTTTRGKVITRPLASVHQSSKIKKPYSRKELADEVFALTGRQYDPTYLADCVAGTKKTPNDLEEREILPKAIANLTKRAKRRAA